MSNYKGMTRAEYCRKWRQKNYEKIRTYAAEYRHNNRSKLLEKKKEAYKRDPDTHKLRQKRYRGKQREYQRAKRGLPLPAYPPPPACECCRLPFGRTAHLDHDHRTGKFRGWLCGKCNTGIGSLGDDISGIQRAASYLLSRS